MSGCHRNGRGKSTAGKTSGGDARSARVCRCYVHCTVTDLLGRRVDVCRELIAFTGTFLVG